MKHGQMQKPRRSNFESTRLGFLTLQQLNHTSYRPVVLAAVCVVRRCTVVVAGLVTVTFAAGLEVVELATWRAVAAAIPGVIVATP
jgi:hypothetical protein